MHTKQVYTIFNGENPYLFDLENWVYLISNHNFKLKELQRVVSIETSFENFNNLSPH